MYSSEVMQLLCFTTAEDRLGLDYAGPQFDLDRTSSSSDSNALIHPSAPPDTLSHEWPFNMFSNEETTITNTTATNQKTKIGFRNDGHSEALFLKNLKTKLIELLEILFNVRWRRCPEEPSPTMTRLQNKKKLREAQIDEDRRLKGETDSRGGESTPSCVDPMTIAALVEVTIRATDLVDIVPFLTAIVDFVAQHGLVDVTSPFSYELISEVIDTTIAEIDSSCVVDGNTDSYSSSVSSIQQFCKDLELLVSMDVLTDDKFERERQKEIDRTVTEVSILIQSCDNDLAKTHIDHNTQLSCVKNGETLTDYLPFNVKMVDHHLKYFHSYPLPWSFLTSALARKRIEPDMINLMVEHKNDFDPSLPYPPFSLSSICNSLPPPSFAPTFDQEGNLSVDYIERLRKQKIHPNSASYRRLITDKIPTRIKNLITNRSSKRASVGPSVQLSLQTPSSLASASLSRPRRLCRGKQATDLDPTTPRQSADDKKVLLNHKLEESLPTRTKVKKRKRKPFTYYVDTTATVNPDNAPPSQRPQRPPKTSSMDQNQTSEGRNSPEVHIARKRVRTAATDTAAIKRKSPPGFQPVSLLSVNNNAPPVTLVPPVPPTRHAPPVSFRRPAAYREHVESLATPPPPESVKFWKPLDSHPSPTLNVEVVSGTAQAPSLPPLAVTGPPKHDFPPPPLPPPLPPARSDMLSAEALPRAPPRGVSFRATRPRPHTREHYSPPGGRRHGSPPHFRGFSSADEMASERRPEGARDNRQSASGVQPSMMTSPSTKSYSNSLAKTAATPASGDSGRRRPSRWDSSTMGDTSGQLDAGRIVRSDDGKGHRPFTLTATANETDSVYNRRMRFRSRSRD
eukprot:GHVH01015767.1.p1 GENE.GHVH01015767.1~~GHVH01015767.1.p1  ORF type:complete len:852 (+),score=91.22 GHVH01015767.1:1006-3561(+)